jgi:5'-deoxynucleotidase YfbR-like HD superfamily hydrolase
MARTLELKVDVTRVVAMLLVHDLGEIDASDKFVFAQGGWEERKAAELKAFGTHLWTRAQENRRLPPGAMEKV